MKNAVAIVLERLCFVLDGLPITRGWYTCRWLVKWEWFDDDIIR